MQSLRRLVETSGATALPGVSIRLDFLRPMLSRAVARGYVAAEGAAFVVDGLVNGFNCGVDTSLLRGGRRRANYSTALDSRAVVSAALRKRVVSRKSYALMEWKPTDGKLPVPWEAWRVVAMGMVWKKAIEGQYVDVPEGRPFTDHTESGLNAATDMSQLRHSLDSYEAVGRFFSYLWCMRVGDVASAFLLLPLAPVLWPFFMVRSPLGGRYSTPDVRPRSLWGACRSHVPLALWG